MSSQNDICDISNRMTQQQKDKFNYMDNICPQQAGLYRAKCNNNRQTKSRGIGNQVEQRKITTKERLQRKLEQRKLKE